ncbi:fibrinogen C domain-containing protein 1 [Drosophila bipectinata]|uniref:fibrinogen C domain-containing protein 1 n=1 Tax=Drosophila bipectinata TaxID=42026 RepID=UPI001C89CC65|nr:fibrinogen C domain-containing protein 1-like [Drosophila bipectinata]
MSQYLTKTNEKLSKCDEISSCTTAGISIYHIRLPGVSEFQAPCNGAGWTVIQRRMDGSVNFNRGWNEYRDGFGYLTGEFFIGLEKLHQITKSRKHELYISLGKVDGSTDFAKFDDFRIGSEKDSYPLESVGNCTGHAGDSLKVHLKMKFTTYDRDNDLHQGNCAQTDGGGWWYSSCAHSHLNGRFYNDGKMKNNLYGIFWGTWQNNDWSVSLTFVEMMIKPSQ